MRNRWICCCMFFVAGNAAWASQLVEGELGRRLDAYMSEQEKNGFYGALLVATQGEVVLSKGYGWADRDAKIPVDSETAFSTGSITKQFTGAAILKLEEQGRLRVTDPMHRYLEGVPQDKRSITLHHLLTHSAGFPSAIGSDYEAINRDGYLKRAFATPLPSPPGETYRYSNVGYSLLGAIIEIVSGQGYEEYLRENLFLPAGMDQTGYRLPNWNRLAHGYREGKDWGTMLDQKWASDGPYWNLRANGGILSTIEDMHRWHRALLGDQVLSETSRQKLFSPHVPEGPQARSHYGYGWSIVDGRWGKLTTHNGGNGIFRADFCRFLDRDVVVYISSSRSDKPCFHLVSTILALAMGESQTTFERVELPDTPAGRLTARFSEAAQSESREEREGFVSQYLTSRIIEKYSVSRLAGLLGQLLGDFQGRELRLAREDPEGMLLLLGGEPGWIKIYVHIDGESQKVDGFSADNIDAGSALDILESVKSSNPGQQTSESRPGDGGWGLPASPTGRRGSQILDALKAAEPEHIEKLFRDGFSPELQNRMPLEELTEKIRKASQDWGEFRFAEARKTSSLSAELRLRTRKGDSRVSFELEPGDAARIVRLVLTDPDG